VSPDGAYVVSCGQDRLVKVWDYRLRGPQPLNFQSFLGHSAALTDVCWATDGRHVVSASSDGALIMWRFDGVRRKIERERRHL
jgi:WD40 repeat protein